MTAPPGLGSWPARRARSAPDAVAVLHGGRRRTYRELAARVAALAGGLRDGLGDGLGVRPGDRVAYLGPNHPSFLETLFATTTLGAVFVPLNTRLAGAELAAVLDDADARVLVHAAAGAEVPDGGPVRVPVDDDPAGPYESLLGHGPVAARDVPPDDTAVLMYTSGTTGRPKGACLSHANLTWNAVNVLVDVDLTGDEVTLVSAPLFHAATLGMTVLPTLLKGGTLVVEERFDPERTLDLVETERVTLAFGVPTMFEALARSARWPDADLTSLRHLLCGGAPVPLDLIERYGERGLTFQQGYGMTEAAPGVLLLDAAESRRRAGSAGTPHFFTDVRLDGPPGGRGELLVRGPNVIGGYRHGAGAGSFDDGWFRSGDVAEVDDGFYRIVDRAKDMYISGGENVYPAEVEAALRRHPAVADVAVIGVPDPTWGEVGHALVVPAPGAAVDTEGLRAFAGQHLGRYKLPARVTVVEELPRNPTGKLDKVALRRAHGS